MVKEDVLISFFILQNVHSFSTNYYVSSRPLTDALIKMREIHSISGLMSFFLNRERMLDFVQSFLHLKGSLYGFSFFICYFHEFHWLYSWDKTHLVIMYYHSYVMWIWYANFKNVYVHIDLYFIWIFFYIRWYLPKCTGKLPFFSISIFGEF